LWWITIIKSISMWLYPYSSVSILYGTYLLIINILNRVFKSSTKIVKQKPVFSVFTEQCHLLRYVKNRQESWSLSLIIIINIFFILLRICKPINWLSCKIFLLEILSCLSLPLNICRYYYVFPIFSVYPL